MVIDEVNEWKIFLKNGRLFKTTSFIWNYRRRGYRNNCSIIKLQNDIQKKIRTSDLNNFYQCHKNWSAKTDQIQYLLTKL